MTPTEYEKLGQSLRNAVDGNLLAGSFAAELAGESYPFNKAMCIVMFDAYTDIALGEKFDKWMKKREAK